MRRAFPSRPPSHPTFHPARLPIPPAFPSRPPSHPARTPCDSTPCDSHPRAAQDGRDAAAWELFDGLVQRGQLDKFQLNTMRAPAADAACSPDLSPAEGRERVSIFKRAEDLLASGGGFRKATRAEAERRETSSGSG